MTAPVYALMIDWDADTAFTDETGRVLDFRIDRGRRSLVSGDRLTEVSPGYASITLDNYDGRYDPFNVDGALYGYVKPNRPMYLTATYDGSTYYLFTGWVRKIVNQSGRKLVRLECYDGIDWLMTQRGILSAYSATGEDVHTAIASIVDVTDWADGNVSAESGTDTIDTVWYDPELSVWEEIEQIRETFFGELFVDAEGVLTYYKRTHLPSPTLTLTQSQCLKDIELQQPWDEIRNDYQMSVYPRVLSATAETLYELDEKIFIAASGSATIYAPYELEGDPAVIVALNTPVATTDYTANSAADGSGTDRTANLTVTPTAYATQAKVVLENTSGTYDLYVTMLNLKGQVTTPAELIKRDSEAASQADYGKMSIVFDAVWMQDSADAEDVLGSVKSVLAKERKVPTVTIVERPDVQYAADLFDELTMDFPKLGLSGFYKIVRIEHSWTGGEGAETRWRLEPTLKTLTTLWLLGTSELGVTTYLS